MLAALLAAALASSVSPNPPAAPPERVYAGVFLRDVSGFDLKEGRFHADLDVWVKWSGAPDVPPLTFLNGELTARELVTRESDGDWHGARWRVQGTFRGTFPLHAFPFDQQTLKVELGLPSTAGQLVPDLASSGMSDTFSITGWRYEPFFQAEAASRVRASDFGSVTFEGQPSVEESVHFAVQLRRPYSSYVAKFMIPLAVILAMAFLVFFLPSDRIDVRGGVGVTALLSVVAFHFAMASTIPDVPYLVAADKLFLVAYALVLLSVVTTVVAFNLRARWPRLSDNVDRGAYVLLPLVALFTGAGTSSPAWEEEAPAPPPQVAAAEAPGPSGEDELRVGITSVPSLGVSSVMALTRRGLGPREGDGDPVPHLAEALPQMTNAHVRLLPDGGMWVRWRLRPGLRWSDGAPLTSDDVAFTFGLSESPDRTAVEVVDERTVVVTYARRVPAFLSPFRIFPRHALQAHAADGGAAVFAHAREHPTPGDGPFRVLTYEPGEELVLERNPHFAGARPGIARVRFVAIGAGNARAALEAGAVDLVANLSDETLLSLDGLAGVVTHQSPSPSLMSLQPDLGAPPFSDPRARQALAQGLRRAAIAAEAYGRSAQVASGYRHPREPDAARDLALPPEDPDRARAQLAETGWKPGAELPLYVLEHDPKMPYGRAVKMIAEDLERLGFRPKITPESSAALTRLSQSAAHGGLVVSQSDSSGGVGRLFNLPTVGGRYDLRTPRPHFDAETVALHGRMEQTLFEERRRVLSQALQRRWARALPVIPIGFSSPGMVHVARLRGPPVDSPANPFWNAETWWFEGGSPKPGGDL